MKRSLILLLACALASSFPLLAEADETPALTSARTRLANDIAESRTELQALDQRIQAERQELLRQADTLRASIQQLRQELHAQEERHADAADATARARESSAHMQEIIRYQGQAIQEYRRALEAQLSAAESQFYAPRIAAVDLQLDAGEPLTVVPELLDLSLDQLNRQLGGAVMPGKALDPEGRLVDGLFGQAGPLLYFAATQGEPVGIAVSTTESLLPRVFSDFPDQTAPPHIARIMSGEEAVVPVDPSLGAAIKVSQSRESLMDHLRKGGVTMIPLLALALACTLMALYKLVSLWMLRTRGAEPRIAEILMALRRNEANEAYAIARRLRKPLGPVLFEGIDHRDAPKEHIEEIMYERLLAQVPSLERLLSPLAVCASVAPLLGLLGTVTGMIHTFRLITIFGTGDARVLSGGISEALITTEVGLVIAIPALLVHAYLSRRVRKAVAATQQSAIMFVNGLKLRLDESAPPARDGAP